MTVRELIAKLQALPEEQQDLQVTFFGSTTTVVDKLIVDVEVNAAYQGYGQQIQLS
jgi:hypothetical protein